MTTADILIVGGGHAGAQAAHSLRQAGFAGSIAMLSAEPDAPYERPPLSKEFLLGERDFATMALRAPAFWQEKSVTLQLGATVTAVDPARRVIRTASGESHGYGALIWAAGGHARRLACGGHDAAGVHTLRSRQDAEKLQAELATARNAVIIGGGYIGLEAAAVLRKLGKTVTILEREERLLARVAGADLSRFFQDEHQRQGAQLILGAEVECIEADAGRATGVRLAGGQLLPADLVIVGVGLIPNVSPLLLAGAEGSNGVTVDAYCRTSLPGIYAVGDCAAHENRFAAGRRVRLESVQNAVDQAQTAARHIAGQAEPYGAVPWFWSQQYDLRLQTVGLSIGFDAAILRGDPATRAFSVIYLRDGAVIALDCVNTPRDYVQGKALVVAGAAVAPELLADSARPLKTSLEK